MGSTWTLLRQGRLPRSARAAPARIVAIPPTDLLCPPRRLADGSRPPTPEGSQPAFAWGDVAMAQPLSGPLQVGLRFLPRPLPAAPSVRLAARLPSREDYGLTTLHRGNLRGLGPASTPVARHLRRMSSEHPDLATYLLVQACQHLWLVCNHDAYGGSPGLTIPRAPGPRPPWCWQSRLRLTLRSPSRGMRYVVPRASHPAVARDARLGRRLLAEQQVLSPPYPKSNTVPATPSCRTRLFTECSPWDRRTHGTHSCATRRTRGSFRARRRP